MSMDPAPPAWEMVCYPERKRLLRRATNEERQAAAADHEAENRRRIGALADWVLAEGLKEAADDADEFERFLVDETQRMRPDELDVLQRAVCDRTGRNSLIAKAMRSSPTSAFLETVAQLVENNALSNAAGQHKAKKGKMEHLTDEQIEYAELRLAIRRLLLETYRGAATPTAIANRTNDVARYLLGMSEPEARAAWKQYDNTDNRDLPKLRWTLRSGKIPTRGE
ncbi:hypothetical protein EFD56_13860 [Rhizobium phaseoli]|uniref:hypothetical protein n=1 Tax=Rhizobium phaseoli TaxID=396 RepID=UPI000F878607|nr:hypothetical protein [Rhizobium phaseoli]RUM18549.1 hypothetical protein EFD56_13860 [Rhizobium phaseoli]